MTHSFTCFDGFRRIATGALPAVALHLQRAMAAPDPGPVLLFDDATGRTRDIDTRGSEQELLARLSAADGAGHASPTRPARPAVASTAASNSAQDSQPAIPEPRGRGRPKLGVIAREVTLLPRHWDWLATQSGGASVALRKLVEQARRADTDDTRMRHDRAYHFMSAIAGDLPGFEEAIRALFANDRVRFDAQVGPWPEDVRGHAAWLAFGDAIRPGDAGAAPSEAGDGRAATRRDSAAATGRSH